MANNLRNWTLNDYTSQEWTDIARAPAAIHSIIIANTNTAPVTAEIRISHGPDELRATIIPAIEIEATTSHVIDLCRLNLGRQDRLQVRASDTGIEVTASGEDMS